MAKNIGLTLLAPVLGISWLYFLLFLTNGMGLNQMGIAETVMNLSVVAFLSFVTFAMSSQTGWYTHLGWLGGQGIFLIYDVMPRPLPPGYGRGLLPTNFSEAVVFGCKLVIVLNWVITDLTHTSRLELGRGRWAVTLKRTDEDVPTRKKDNGLFMGNRNFDSNMADLVRLSQVAPISK